MSKTHTHTYLNLVTFSLPKAVLKESFGIIFNQKRNYWCSNKSALVGFCSKPDYFSKLVVNLSEVFREPQRYIFISKRNFTRFSINCVWQFVLHILVSLPCPYKSKPPSCGCEVKIYLILFVRTQEIIMGTPRVLLYFTLLPRHVSWFVNETMCISVGWVSN